jgi:hypothetical protein
MGFMVRAIALQGVVADEYGEMAQGSLQEKKPKEFGEKPAVWSLTTNLT